MGIAKEEAEEMAVRFTYHPPKGNQQEDYETIRNYAHTFALLINDVVPMSREQSLAITKLEEVVFWANAGIARRTV